MLLQIDMQLQVQISEYVKPKSMLRKTWQSVEQS